MEGGYREQAMISPEDFWKVQGQMVKESPHCYIGAVWFQTDKGQVGVGSGALISQNIILTSGHNIFNKLYQKFMKNFKFYLGVDGVGERYYEVENFKILEDFKTSKSKVRLKHDYAIMKLKQSIKFDKYLMLAFPCQACLTTNKSIELNIYGFPKDYKENWKNLDKKGDKKVLFQYGLTRKNKYQMINASNGQIAYKINTLGGHSGSPVTIGNTIIAIHNAFQQEKGYNIGRIICPELVQNVKDWIRQVNGSPFVFEESKCSHSKVSIKKIEKDQLGFIAKQETVTNQKQKNTVVKSCFPQLNYEDCQKPSQSKILRHQQTQLTLLNDEIRMLDLSKRSNLTKLTLNYCSLQQINLSLCPLLTNVNLQGNHLKSVNLDSISQITHLDLTKNEIVKINLASNPKLLDLNLSINNLVTIDLSKNKKLTILRLWANPLTSIDVGLNTELQKLSISKAHIPKIILKNNQRLTHLDILNSGLKEIDLSKNINLRRLKLHNNVLKEIGLLKNTRLERLVLNSNKLATVSIVFSESLWSAYTTFGIFDQNTSDCKIALKLDKPEYREKAAEVVTEWTHLLNKEKCNYVIVIQK